MSHLIRRFVSTSSRMVKAKVPVFSSTGDTSRMVTGLGFREKINLVMLGTPNRAETGNYGLDTSVEEWKAGALTGVEEVTKALARRNWDLLGSGLVTADCLARLRRMEIRDEDRPLAEVNSENVFFSFIAEEKGFTLVTFSLPVMGELLRTKAKINKYINENRRIMDEKKVKVLRKKTKIEEAAKTAASKKDLVGWRDANKNYHRMREQFEFEIQELGVKVKDITDDSKRNMDELLRKNNDVVIGNYKLCLEADSWTFSEISQTKASVAWDVIWRNKMAFVLLSSLINDEDFQNELRENYIKRWIPFYKHTIMNRVFIIK